jgi:outer membrane protein assembly factor BamB
MSMDRKDEAENQGAPPRSSNAASRVRWWPLLLILALAALALLGVWLAGRTNHQERNIRTAVVGLVTGLLVVLWGLFFSRLRWRVKLAMIGALAGVIGALAGALRIQGVTGDLVPIFEWRWARPQASPPAAPPRSPPTNDLPAVTASAGAGGDFPQFLGPHRNATVPGPRLVRDWKVRPPTLRWRRPVGAGWSGFAIAGRHAVTQEQRDENETVVAYDLLTGQLLWTFADPAHYQTTIAGEGPRATPTLVGRRVFALGATGRLHCLDLDTGARLWTKDVIADNQSKMPEWGMSGSPLVWEDCVIVSPGHGKGQCLVAYRAATGERVWIGGRDGPGYSSPYPATLAGVEQVLMFNSGSMSGHDRRTGELLWDYPWPRGHPHVAMPLVLANDRVLVSSGYGAGSELLQIKHEPAGTWTAARMWKSMRLKAKFTNVVQREGHIYGLDDGILVCLDAATGEQRWKDGRYGHGQVILVGDLLLVSAESGELVLVEPAPQEHRELGRIVVFERKTWNPPALAGASLLMRNDREAACYRLATSE